jgi:hypothetical protein
MNIYRSACTILLLICLPIIASAQTTVDVAPLTPWPAPLYWQPTRIALADGVNATTPASSLVFVGMTPCRVVDTRTGSGFTGAFGTPSLVGGASRTFPIQSSTTCSIPSIAQAYSFNITVVPPGFLDFITVWPTGQPRPNASTLNGYVGTVIANAAIVPAGTSGSVDVYASQFTDLIIDINGYYAPQSGITLTQGSAGAPSLSFDGDAGTGIFSAGAGSVDISTGGTRRLTVLPNGNVGIGTPNPTATLTVNGTAAVSGGLSIGGGGVVTNSDNLVQSGASALTVTIPNGTTIFAATCISQTVSAPGATTSMAVVISPSGDPNTRGLGKLIWSAYVNANGQVTAEFCKFGSGSALSTADQTFNVRILK